VGDEAVVADPGRPTTLRRRYVATAPGGVPRQVLRVDVESREPLPRAVEARLLEAIEAWVPACEIILVSDYDKGVCTPAILRRIMGWARESG
jgi:D-beta-D-heptose 7-phosphate kinase/D-beta-D-heptose 1-phosphate adenosyltransferase